MMADDDIELPEPSGAPHPIVEIHNRALSLLKTLVEHGSWYGSAIELDHITDGEDLYDEAIAIFKKARIVVERQCQ